MEANLIQTQVISLKNPAKDDEKVPTKEPQDQKPNQEKKDLITK